MQGVGIPSVQIDVGVDISPLPNGTGVVMTVRVGPSIYQIGIPWDGLASFRQAIVECEAKRPRLVVAQGFKVQ